MEEQNYKKKFIRILKDTIAGTCGGIAQVLTGQPFDTVKVRLQTQENLKLMECVTKIIKEEGILAFYKGTTSPLIGVGACVSIQFAVVESSKRFFKDQNQNKEITYSQYFISGALAGVANSIVSIPVEHIRIRMQVQTNKPGEKALYSSSIDCFKKIYHSYGLKGIYKGGITTIVREFQGYGTYFLVYEWIIRKLTPEGKTVSDLSISKILFAGGIAGYSWWIPVYPIDVIKSKLQTDSFINPQYKGFFDCLKKTIHNQGIYGLYRGFIPCMIRAIPGFYIYD
jgi:solute carrier family 25 carnitine/acylcarnitine transporter 20/29